MFSTCVEVILPRGFEERFQVYVLYMRRGDSLFIPGVLYKN